MLGEPQSILTLLLIFVASFPLELPLNMRRKDLRKTINMIDGETFVCHGSGDEEASCRHCNTAGNPGYD
jgi:hypothetical protein